MHADRQELLRKESEARITFRYIYKSRGVDLNTDGILLEEINEKVDKILIRLKAGMELKKDIIKNIDNLLAS